MYSFVDKWEQSDLYQAVIVKNIEKIKCITKSYTEDEYIDAAFEYAAGNWDNTRTPKILEVLIEAGADVNKCCNLVNVSALHLAAKRRNIEAIKFLLDHGANVDARTIDGTTPLLNIFYPFYKYDDQTGLVIKVAKLLVSKGADVNAQDSGGTALHYAASYHYDSSLLKTIIDFGADVNMIDFTGETPLSFLIRLYSIYIRDIEDENLTAIQKSNMKNLELRIIKKVECLLRNGANPSLRYKQRKTVLQNLLTLEKFEFFQLLRLFFKKGADINFVDDEGKNVLQYTNNLQQDKCKILIQHIALLQISDSHVDSGIISTILSKHDYNDYLKMCREELKRAKSTRLPGSYLTFFNFIVDSEDRFLKYAFNKKLITDFKNGVKDYPIYCAWMEENVSKGIDEQKTWSEAAQKLSYHCPIFDPNHLIVRDVLDCLDIVYLQKLTE